MTFPLSITLQTPDRTPVVGASCIVTPQTVVPDTDTGVVLSTAAATTDANGHCELNLIPSVAGTWYILRINANTRINVINPFRFQMPAQATSLSELMQGAITRGEPIPEGVRIEFPSPPFSTITYPALTDINIPVGDAAFTFGDWVDIYHLTNNSPETAIYMAVFDLVFDPAWGYANDDRAEVDVRLRHVDSDDTLIRELEYHNFDYIRNIDASHALGSVEATGLAELSHGQYIEVDVRVARQQPSTARSADRTVQLVGAESALQVRVDRAITLTTVRIATDNTLKLTSTGYGVANPFTHGDENKLDGIEAGAQVNRSAAATRDLLYTPPLEQRLDITRLKGYNAPSQTNPSLGELPDVTITNPATNDLLIQDGSDYVNRQLRAILDGADLVASIENRPPSNRIDRKYLAGQTTVLGGPTLPAPADVSNWTLFVRQSTSADNPGLYMTGATYDVPISNRNRIIVTPDSTGEFFLGQRGSVVDNYDNVLGQFIGRAIGGGRALLGLAIHFGSDTPVTTPPANLYVRGINGNNNVRTIARSVSSQHPTGTFSTINGKQYAEYVDTVATSVVDNVDGNAQTLTFFTNGAGSLPMNIKPATEHRARNWHLQTHVQGDWNQTDSQSPHFIQNKPNIPTIPTPNSIGRVVARTATLPVGSLTTFQRAGTTQVSRYIPTLTAGDVTTGYTVTGNSVVSSQPHPPNQIGWYARAVTSNVEVCRVFIPLTATITYSGLDSILGTTSVVSHAHMGTTANQHYYLAYQASMGAQVSSGGTGDTGHDIVLFIAAPQQPFTTRFPINTHLELVEAVVG